MTTQAARLVVAPGVLLQELAGEAVILDLKSERYFGLDPTALAMWNHLTRSGSVPDAYAALLEEYDVSAERLRADLDAFVEELLHNGLLEHAPA